MDKILVVMFARGLFDKIRCQYNKIHDSKLLNRIALINQGALQCIVYEFYIHQIAFTRHSIYFTPEHEGSTVVYFIGVYLWNNKVFLFVFKTHFPLRISQYIIKNQKSGVKNEKKWKSEGPFHTRIYFLGIILNQVNLKAFRVRPLSDF